MQFTNTLELTFFCIGSLLVVALILVILLYRAQRRPDQPHTLRPRRTSESSVAFQSVRKWYNSSPARYRGLWIIGWLLKAVGRVFFAVATILALYTLLLHINSFINLRFSINLTGFLYAIPIVAAGIPWYVIGTLIHIQIERNEYLRSLGNLMQRQLKLMEGVQAQPPRPRRESPMRDAWGVEE